MIKCIAIDDEPLALDVMENYISKTPELEFTGRYTSPMEALEVLNSGSVDLLFLDIQMSEISGIQFLKTLKNPPLVILTTAYDNYALQGYDLDVVDYLLKPIPFERFLKAVNKAVDLYRYNKNALSKEVVSYEHGYIFIKSEYQILKIDLKDILYVEGLKDYVKIFCINHPHPILSLQNLKAIESKLPVSHFVRVHKSFIVALPKINAVHKGRIRIGEKEIPIGDNYKDTFLKHIN